MLLSDFLQHHAPLTAVELLPDHRLINVVVGGGALFGVEVESVPEDVRVTRHAATYDGVTISAPSVGASFEAALYSVLGTSDG